jgi:anti-sigma regulatory factor (Ser/Thr protein kinase)
VNIVEVPAQLDDATFDALVERFDEARGARMLMDARRLRWVDPYGMLGLLVLGELAYGDGERPRLELPESADVLSYLTRMGFFRHAATFFETPTRRRGGDGASDVLLEITPVRSHTDVHRVVDRVNERALAILTRQLNYPLREAFQFSVMLSEVCQNIIDHAESGGWVATQTYNWAKRLGRKVVQISVMDLGVGFKGSLASEHAARYGNRWSDASALEAAFIHGLTRFHDPGRGQGLQQIRKQVGRWSGKVAIRSGTARIADVPAWDDAQPLEEELAPLPGAQISIVLPASQAVEGQTAEGSHAEQAR